MMIRVYVWLIEVLLRRIAERYQATTTDSYANVQVKWSTGEKCTEWWVYGYKGDKSEWGIGDTFSAAVDDWLHKVTSDACTSDTDESLKEVEDSDEIPF